MFKRLVRNWIRMRKYGSKRKKGANLSKGSFSAYYVQMISVFPSENVLLLS
jgi:hypothetical protein